MITDKDVQKLAKVFVTKEDLKILASKDELKNLATKEDIKVLATSINELAADVVRIKEWVERLDDKFDGLTTFKSEHDHMKTIIRENLKVEV